MSLTKRFHLLLRVIPIVVGLLVAKVIINRLKLEFITVDGLVPSLVAGAIFLIGFLLSHVMAHYKEAERMPGEMRAALEAIHDDVAAFARTRPGVDIAGLKTALRDIVTSLESGLGLEGHHHELARAEAHVDSLSDRFVEVESLGMPEPYVVRLRNSQDGLRKTLFRISYIQTMESVPSMRLLVQTLVIACLILILFIRTEGSYEVLHDRGLRLLPVRLRPVPDPAAGGAVPHRRGDGGRREPLSPARIRDKNGGMIHRRRVLGLLAGAGSAPGRFAKAADPAALSADIALLARIYETLHPGLYRYQTPAAFSDRCARLEAATARPASLPVQYLRLSGLLAQIRCGHTWANVFNQSAAVSRVVVDEANKLPFHFIWLGDRMVVADNPLAIEGLARGDEVLSIDGVPVAAIQAALLPYMRADGANDAKRRALLNVTGADRIETFDVFYPLVFPKAPGRFSLVMRRGDGPHRHLTLDPIDQPVRRAMAPRSSDAGAADYWRLSWANAAVAVITMPGWAVYDVKWDWRARIAALMEAVAQRAAGGLVIDLRDNEGGEDCGNEIIARLIDQDLPLYADYERRVRFRSTPAILNPYLDTWDRSFEHLGEGATDLGNGFYRLENEADSVRRITPQGPRFKGKVIVLSSAQNSSATLQFIDLARRAGLARIYGESTGGNQRGINGGSFFFVRLPASGLEADLPLVGLFPKTAKPDAGLMPDVSIAPTLADLAAGRDAVLERAVTDLV